MKEIVIKIDENKWTYAREHNFLDMGSNELANAIINGTELPNGHGELIDQKTLLDDLYKRAYTEFTHRDFVALVSYQSTIIEADKEYEVEVVTRGNCMICGKELTEGLFFCKECEGKVKKEGEK